MGQFEPASTCGDADLAAVSLVYRNKIIFHRFLRKRTLTNPKRGPIHFRSPSKIFWRTLRGMVPHKTVRGNAALQRLQVFDGIPKPFDQMKRMVVPDALKINRLKNARAFCVLGDLADQVGWKHKDLIVRLENKRKDRAALFYQRKKAKNALAAKAQKLATAQNMGHPVVKGNYNDLTTQLGELGY